jgi:hypothetical protein
MINRESVTVPLQVVNRGAIFDDDSDIINFDDVIPYAELNSSVWDEYDYYRHEAGSSARPSSQRHGRKSQYLVGRNSAFKLRIVVTPVQDRLLSLLR